MTRAAEHTHVDPSNGRIVNANLAEYHVPVNADIGSIDVSAIDIPDTKIDLLGARGIGEWHYRYGGGDCQCDLSRHRQTGSRSADHSGQTNGMMIRVS